MFHFFSGEKYTSMSHGITSVFSYENEEWRSVAAADFEISDYITSEKLTELIFGQFWGQLFSTLLQALSCCGGISFLIGLMRKLLKANNECFQRPIEIKFEQPSIPGKDHSVVQIEDEHVHKTQVLNSKGMQHQHTLQIESEDEEFPPPYFLKNESYSKTRHRDAFFH